MRVTIDSSERLSDVLRVVGSLYGVTLTAAEAGSSTGAATSGTATSGGQRRSRRGGAADESGRGKRERSRRATDDGARVDPKVVRQWAWENGHDVNARGSLPASVRDAYAAANPS